MKTTKEQKIVTVQTKVDAPMDLVWKLWNTPGDIVRWSYGSEDWHTTRAENDLRPGGKFRYRMEAKDGSQGFDFEGVYDKVIPMERIDYTMADGRKATIIFSKTNGKVKIMEDFEPEKENPVEMQHDGWQFILNNFKRYAEVKAAFMRPPRITHQITPCLWFDNQAEEAVNFYASVFKNSKIIRKTYFTKEGYEIHGQKEGSVMTVDFQINGQPFTALNGGPVFKFTEAISLQVFCDTQHEIDYYWERLTEGGEESQCCWLKDKYGVSWQIVPSVLPGLLSDPAKADKVLKVLYTMKKPDIEKLKRA
ncbi:MAG: VOC family protein [Bacteroidales bacterium]|nr:VOC family protein [Bacteroidales bacterium]